MYTPKAWMMPGLIATVSLTVPAVFAEPDGTVPFTVDSMVRVVFTGDSQACGRNLAIDYPQLMSRIAPIRAINTGVGGSNSSALLRPMKSGLVRVTKGERVLYGEKVRWGTGPFPGMTVDVNGETYTIDHIVEYRGQKAELHLTEPARADYQGAECSVEPGWEVRVAQHRPDVVTLMYINDGTMPEAKQEDWREMIRRIRALGAVPVLMSPVPVDDSAHGGNHPGDNAKVAQNAAAIRALAYSEKTWFVDVFNLYFDLDPAFRGLVRDGIHPDTDGQRVIVNALNWVFQQMGLFDARPFIKGWVLTGDRASLPELLSTAVRHFTISQPDHPDPDRQVTEEFTLEAIRRNDEYGLVARKDGSSMAVDKGLLFRCALPQTPIPASVSVRLCGTGLSDALAWDMGHQCWRELPLHDTNGWLEGTVFREAIQDGVFHLLVNGAAQARLDALAVDVRGVAAPRPWQPSAVQPSSYVITSDHDRDDNLLANADFVRGAEGQAEGWRLRKDATVNRPLRTSVGSVAFNNAKDLRVVLLEQPGHARPFDLLEVHGSSADNDGPYRLREDLGNGRFRVRKRAKTAEEGLQGILVRNDGCGLVPGGCCLELAGEGAAVSDVRLPSGIGRLYLSLFYRVFDPEALGTRDVPQNEARITLQYGAGDKRPLGEEQTLGTTLECSYQWQKAEMSLAVPPHAHYLKLSLSSASGARVQYTGIYVGPHRDATK